MNRSILQQHALTLWERSGSRGTLCLATGFGKTRCGVLAANKEVIKKNKVLIIVPTQNLRDKEWRDEISKWSSKVYLENKSIQIECIQTVYKWSREQFDEYNLVVVDEIHTTLTPAYGKIFPKLKNKVLGLTATPPADPIPKVKLDKHAPIIYEYGLDKAVENNILSSYVMYNLGVDMPKDEKKKYTFFTTEFSKAQKALNAYIFKSENKLLKTAFDAAQVLKDEDPKKYFKKEKKAIEAAKKFWQFMTMRRWACYNNSNKIPIVLDILNSFPERKWIIFTKSIKSCEKIAEAINKDKTTNIHATFYHSKQSDAERAAVLKKFSRKNAKSNVLVSVDALATGYNLPEINSAICVSGVSVERIGTQQLGRILRLVEGKIGLFINLYSKDTQEFQWIRRKTDSFKNCKWISETKEIRL
jgi:superfamily II DNA or RNA helicase